ncbi:putative serine/threonine protein kinase KKQ8 NDAI_0A00940 [Naumovozyma dairenensis CBS 421]|uniref:non-specific serine/threonine protein kinase n=1 Tax=Naumovozyma dairenensis (strain ATCC 10597 / BCRC 20456 / CBS 421 / NBRC 0211 / NRRL Y-12639) TaxID=1071378 RepID=G0W364_NAUDC|nr:hypothetical protein NDAI_0A00940 [Naumovozyma dairenensis CBS 421]CCD22252.1 hypothetical protein NDAI_0A00940 [Naumovozyma dairenensis CBS 421]
MTMNTDRKKEESNINREERSLSHKIRGLMRSSSNIRNETKPTTSGVGKDSIKLISPSNPELVQKEHMQEKEPVKYHTTLQKLRRLPSFRRTLLVSSHKPGTSEVHESEHELTNPTLIPSNNKATLSTEGLSLNTNDNVFTFNDRSTANISYENNNLEGTRSVDKISPISKVAVPERGRSKFGTMSARNLPAYSQTKSHCIIDVEGFQVYDNGTHVHRLRYLPLVCENTVDGKNCNKLNAKLEKAPKVLPRQKSGMFSMGGLFKTQRADDAFENAVSLIPDGGLRLLKKRFQPADITSKQNVDPKDGELEVEGPEEEEEEVEVPNAVNTLAAIDKNELKLITCLSKRIHDGLASKHGLSNEELFRINQEDKSKDRQLTLFEKYGKRIGDIGQGSYGTVKVCCRLKKPNEKLLSPNVTYSDDSKVFFAAKELKAKSTSNIDKIATNITSEFIIGYSLSYHENSKLSHPNILKILDLMESRDSFIEVMEFCPCGDLYTLVSNHSKKHTSLHPLEADCFMRQLLSGTNFMHRHGIAHCDLKPENILFHSNGLLKICDFGTGSVFQTAWEKHVHYQKGLIGSEPYVAPEELVKDLEYDPRLVDSWSCGVVYCTMILGHYLWKIPNKEEDLFYQDFVEEMSTKKRFTVFEDLKHVNKELNRLRKITLYRIFQRDPEKRANVQDVLDSAWMRNTKCCIFYKEY